MNKKLKYKIFGFTLIELMITLIIIGLIIPSMFAIYTFLIRSNKEIGARERTIQRGYEFFERLNVLMQDYTVDYEEYYNRQMVGCVGTEKRGSSFEWNVDKDGYCTNFTAYGNNSPNNSIYQYLQYVHDIYYCSTQKEVSAGRFVTRVVKQENRTSDGDCGRQEGWQSYGQYAALFKDVKSGTGIIVGTDDDEELGDIFNPNVDAIADGSHIQELYLISHDGKKRLYFRRKNVASDSEEPHYKIQVLRLRGFDAGRMHSFENGSNDNAGRYDGVIDTWACDAGMGFIGHGSCVSVNGAYDSYCLPIDANDCWVDLTYGVTNMFSRNISISPLGDPDLYWANPNHQINTYMKILTVNGIYLPGLFGQSRISESIKDFKVPLETIINMKDFYKGYSQ